MGRYNTAVMEGHNNGQIQHCGNGGTQLRADTTLLLWRDTNMGRYNTAVMEGHNYGQIQHCCYGGTQ